MHKSIKNRSLLNINSSHVHLEISKYKSHYLVISPTAKDSQQLIYSDKNTLNKKKKTKCTTKQSVVYQL